MKYFITLLFLLFVLNACAQEIEIKPLHPYSETRDTTINGRRSLCKWKYFVVEKGDIRDSADLAAMRAFAAGQLDMNFREYTQFEVIFYRRTRVINEGYRSTPKRGLGYYGDDRIAEFHWSQGHPYEMLLDEGKVLNSNVIITDVPK